MSIGIHNAVRNVHDRYLALAMTGDDETTDEDLKLAEAKFRADTKELHAANYAYAYQVLRTDKASAVLGSYGRTFGSHIGSSTYTNSKRMQGVARTD